MKKKINLMKLALGCVVGGTLFLACNKEEFTGNKELNANAPVHQQDLSIEQKILSFKQRCKFYKDNPQIKAGGLISLDEALWDMEAALNYTYSYSNVVIGEQHVKSSEITLVTSGADSVDFTAVTASYYQMIDSLKAFYSSLNVQGKKVILMDVEKLTNSGQQSLKVTSVIAPVKEVPPTDDDPFGETDYWYFGFLQGKCGPYFGTVSGSDAAKEIEKLQGAYKLPNIPGYHLYFTNVETANVIGDVFINPNDDVPNDNMKDYLMFCNKSNLPNFHDCLTPAEMNFYYHSTYFVLTDPSMVRAQTNPPLKAFISVNLCGVNVPLINYEVVSHFAEANYGIPYYSYDPCFPVSDPTLY